jgi:hypothetical protein
MMMSFQPKHEVLQHFHLRLLLLHLPLQLDPLCSARIPHNCDSTNNSPFYDRDRIPFQP